MTTIVPAPLVALAPIILAVAAVIVPVVQAVKYVGLPRAWAPLASMALGVVLMFLLGAPAPWGELVVAGIVAGAMASGLWEAITPGSGVLGPLSPPRAVTSGELQKGHFTAPAAPLPPEGATRPTSPANSASPAGGKTP